MTYAKCSNILDTTNRTREVPILLKMIRKNQIIVKF